MEKSLRIQITQRSRLINGWLHLDLWAHVPVSFFFVSDHVLAEVSEITAATDLPNVTSHVAGVINNTFLLSDAISAD